jgi:hypothetical protein
MNWHLPPTIHPLACHFEDLKTTVCCLLYVFAVFVHCFDRTCMDLDVPGERHVSQRQQWVGPPRSPFSPID